MWQIFLLLASGPKYQPCTGGDFFGLVPWYHYLDTCDANGNVLKFQVLPSPDGSIHSAIPLVALAVVDDLLRIAAMVAVGYVIYGGVQYITSQGSPDGAAKAKTTILNALIGLVIAITAIGVVSYIGGQLS